MWTITNGFQAIRYKTGHPYFTFGRTRKRSGILPGSLTPSDLRRMALSEVEMKEEPGKFFWYQVWQAVFASRENWEGKQIISPHWIAESTRPNRSVHPDYYRYYDNQSL